MGRGVTLGGGKVGSLEKLIMPEPPLRNSLPRGPDVGSHTFQDNGGHLVEGMLITMEDEGRKKGAPRSPENIAMPSGLKRNNFIWRTKELGLVLKQRSNSSPKGKAGDRRRRATRNNGSNTVLGP